MPFETTFSTEKDCELGVQTFVCFVKTRTLHNLNKHGGVTMYFNKGIQEFSPKVRVLFLDDVE